MERNLATVWESVADAVGEQTALVQGEARRTWQELEDRASRLAGRLQQAGVGRDSKVAQYLYNSPEYCESYYAGLKLRAIPVNVNYRYLDEELVYLLENSESEALVYHSSLGDRVDRVKDRLPRLKVLVEVDDGGSHLDGAERYEDVVASSDPAARIERSRDDITMIYTGGTTGMPKGVISRVGAAVDGLITTVPPVLGMGAISEPEEIAPLARGLADAGRQFTTLPACPLMHATGLGVGVIPTFTFGGKVVLLASRRLDVDELWHMVEREGVNSIVVVGDPFARPMLNALREGGPRDLSSVVLIVSSGAMFSADIKRGLVEYMPGATILDYMASTEAAMGVSVFTKDAPMDTGRFLPGPGVKLFTEDGREVEAGSSEIGIVAVPTEQAEGYYKDDAKTAQTFQVIDGVRYTVPGDWGSLGADGLITLLGRGSMCINTGGEKVFPEEVEEALKLHPAVEDCLVFGLPDERFGQRIAAIASRGTGASATPEEVVAATREKLSGYKVPRELVFVDVVPRAPNGKADYRAARDMFETATAGAAGP